MSQDNTVVANFAISYFQYLNKEGDCVQKLSPHLTDPARVEKLYRMMVNTRAFDKKAIALQRTGKIGTYPSTLGQEAIGVAIGEVMAPEDVFFPYYREYGAQFLRGVSMEEILLYWGGDESGSAFKKNTHDFPICVPIASQTLHAVGAAFAFQYRKEARVAVVSIGDGGTSRGDFYEALNVAGVWNLPVVFIINNNQWAISVSRAKQCAAETLAQKGIAAGVPGVQVDGNDILVLTHKIEEAIEKARQGKGPTLIEAMTYRMCDHTTADDASRYRPTENLKEYEALDPIARVKRYMEKQGFWDETKELDMLKATTQEINEAVDRYLKIPVPNAERMFKHLYAELPKAYEAQYQALKEGVK